MKKLDKILDVLNVLLGLVLICSLYKELGAAVTTVLVLNVGCIALISYHKGRDEYRANNVISVKEDKDGINVDINKEKSIEAAIIALMQFVIYDRDFRKCDDETIDQHISVITKGAKELAYKARKENNV